MGLGGAGLGISFTARAPARLEIVFIEDASVNEMARGARRDELAIDAGAGALLSHICNAAAPYFDAAEFLGLELVELMGVVDFVDAARPGSHGYGGEVVVSLGLYLFDNLVAAEGDNGDANGNATGNHELRAEQQGSDGREAAFEAKEDAGAHFADYGTNFGKRERDGGEGLGVSL